MMPQLVTWADAGVITRFTTFRRAAISSGGAISALFAMEEVHRAIRKDLGLHECSQICQPAAVMGDSGRQTKLMRGRCSEIHFKRIQLLLSS